MLVATRVLILFLILFPFVASANITLSKYRLYFDSNDRAEALQLRNVGSADAQFTAELTLSAMTEEGEVYSVFELDNAATPLIRYSPKRGTIAPGQRQALRFALRKPAGLADGEYRAVLKLTSSVPTSGTGAVTLSSKLAYSIPIVVRHGRLNATTSLTNPQIVMSQGTPHIQLWQTRQGNRSLFGNFTVSDDKGNEVGVLNGVATYLPLEKRKVLIPLNSDYRGPVTITFTENENYGGNANATLDYVIN
ncbi:fimbrial biogenesis chaperone [Alteromonas ponticola]|uniref:Molecular chaperone n=1 Tax=Alteromonas ponticola TaxID=2720613 RepID=A0ABX1R2X2_9ALTE|nr:molecular chaperone [Alteromonas ponticola]NMH60813.1 molecular chaperone [Alteromonas ponticola]